MDDKYIAGTKRGEGIAFTRTDEEVIKKQKLEIGRIIKEKMDQEGLSLRKLESMSNIYLPQIHKVIHADNNYSIETLLRILNALDIELKCK